MSKVDAEDGAVEVLEHLQWPWLYDAQADVEDKSSEHHHEVQHLKAEPCILWNIEQAMVHVSLCEDHPEANHGGKDSTRTKL